jgi:hypothetical protein
MIEHREGFKGLEEPESCIDRTILLDVEKLSSIDPKNLERVVRVYNELGQENLKRKTAKTFLMASLVVLIPLVFMGGFTGSYEAAKVWWGFLGPIDGYLLSQLFGGKGPPN